MMESFTQSLADDRNRDIRNPGTRDGSTVYAGGYLCECFDCYSFRNRPDLGTPNKATWSCWRITFYGRVRSTWIMCDECLEKSKAAFANARPVWPRSGDDIDIWLPLALLDDVYARGAVEELCYALAGLEMP